MSFEFHNYGCVHVHTEGACTISYSTRYL